MVWRILYFASEESVQQVEREAVRDKNTEVTDIYRGWESTDSNKKERREEKKFIIKFT